MGFRNNCYATVWEVSKANPEKKQPNKIRISISRKEKDTNNYVQDFSGYVACYGDSVKLLDSLQPKDRVRLINTDVSSSYNKETKTTYYNFKVYDMEKASSSYNATVGDDAPQAQPQAPAQSNTSTGEEASDDELPF